MLENKNLTCSVISKRALSQSSFPIIEVKAKYKKRPWKTAVGISLRYGRRKK